MPSITTMKSRTFWFVVAGLLLFSPQGKAATDPINVDLSQRIILAQKISNRQIDQLKEQFKDKLPGRDKAVEALTEAVPTGRDPELTARTLTDSDKLHCEFRMRLANRHFKQENYTRAIEELNSVFSVMPEHPRGRFMRAVIAARQKDYLTSWHSIRIAKEGAPDDKLVDELIKRLETVHPEPTPPPWVVGAAREIPTHASEMAVDLMERIFRDGVSRNINAIGMQPITESAGQAWVAMRFEGSSPVNSETLVALIKKLIGGEIKNVQIGNDSKEVKLEIQLPGLSAGNSSARPIATAREVIESFANEADVVIRDTAERLPDEQKRIETKYSIATRTLFNLNNFLRRLSPYSHHYYIDALRLVNMAGQVVWRGDITVVFQGD